MLNGGVINVDEQVCVCGAAHWIVNTSVTEREWVTSNRYDPPFKRVLLRQVVSATCLECERCREFRDSALLPEGHVCNDNELLDEILHMLDHGSTTDYADTSYAIIAKIKQWQNPNQDPATCEHDWRTAYRETGEEPKHKGDIPAVFFQRCVNCNDTRKDPNERTKAEIAEAREKRTRDLPGQLSLLDVPGVMAQVSVINKGWQIVEGETHDDA